MNILGKSTGTDKSSFTCPQQSSTLKSWSDLRLTASQKSHKGTRSPCARLSNGLEEVPMTSMNWSVSAFPTKSKGHSFSRTVTTYLCHYVWQSIRWLIRSIMLINDIIHKQDPFSVPQLRNKPLLKTFHKSWGIWALIHWQKVGIMLTEELMISNRSVFFQIISHCPFLWLYFSDFIWEGIMRFSLPKYWWVFYGCSWKVSLLVVSFVFHKWKLEQIREYSISYKWSQRTF